MKRVLHVLGGLGLGGAETMIMNLYRHIDKSEFQFDFVVTGNETGYYEPEAKMLGARVYHIRKRTESFLGNLKDFYKTVKNHKYSVLHFHTQNAFFTTLQIFIAKLAGAKKIIVHSHNTMDWRTGISLKLHYVCRPILNLLADVKLSCGAAAAEWLYGNDKDVTVVPLPVDCKKYKFSQEKYHMLREKYRLSESKVYVHTGRFSDQKNHEFLIDVFAEIVKRENNSKLMLLGDGELRPAIEDKVKSLNLQEKVIFCGNVSDVWDRLIASDAFLLPSKYEGFPTVILEAQAAGLPCYISNTITKRIAITNLVSFVDIAHGVGAWVQDILNGRVVKEYERIQSNIAISGEYDVSVVTDKIEEIYRG